MRNTRTLSEARHSILDSFSVGTKPPVGLMSMISWLRVSEIKSQEQVVESRGRPIALFESFRPPPLFQVLLELLTERCGEHERLHGRVTNLHRQLGMLMGTRNETLDLSQPGFQFNGLAGRRITTGDMDLTETVSESILGYYPTLQSVLFRSSCPLHLRQGTADPLRFLQVRRPTSRVHVSIQLEDSIRLTPSRISHNLPGVATRTSTPRASIRPLLLCRHPTHDRSDAHRGWSSRRRKSFRFFLVRDLSLSFL